MLREEDHLALSPALEGDPRAGVHADRALYPVQPGCVGRPPQDRVALARAFVAKAVLDLPTTEALIDRLQADQALRRICGFERCHAIPDASRFSRVFAEFTAWALPARVHEALIRAQLGDQLIGHIARDSTEIEAREKPAAKVVAAATAAPLTVRRRNDRGGTGIRRPGTGQAARAPAQGRGATQGADRH